MDADPFGNPLVFDLLLLILFTLMNAFFAGAEMAVVSVNKTRIHQLAANGNQKAVLIEGLFQDSTKFLSTIQVAITFAGFYSSASAASTIAPMLSMWLTEHGVPYSHQLASNGVTLLLMFFNLVFGELVPKRVALQKAEFFCMMTVKPVHYISVVLSPFIKLLSVSTKGVLKLLRMNTQESEEIVTAEEIKALVKMGNEHGSFDDDARKRIDSIFDFTHRTAKEVRVPRRDVFTIDLNEPFETLLDEILASRYSRIPVFDDDIDNIVGILHVKDVMLALRKTPSLKQFDLQQVLRQPFFVPETQSADKLFRTMQENRQHMAVLVDEHGGFSGIVTIEDLVEEIMGNILEEDEVPADTIEVLGNNMYRIHGGLAIDELNDALGLHLMSDEFETVSGFLIEQLEHIPAQGEQAKVLIDGLQFDIETMKNNRIYSAVLRINQ